MKARSLAVIVSIFMAFGAGLIDSPRANAEDIQFPPCFDIYGRQAKLIVTENESSGPAYATVVDGGPAIFINWNQMNSALRSPDAVKYAYQHECGHVVLGHIYQPRGGAVMSNLHELAADCYAASQFKRLGIFSDAVIRDVALWPVDKEHPAGIVRANNIIRCFRESPNLN